MRQHSAFSITLTLLLAALTAGCGGDVVLPDEGEAAKIEIVSGDEQFGPAGATLAQQVVVRVLDTRDRPVANQEVTFTVGDGGGTVAPAAVPSSAAGEAAASWTLGPVTGDDHLLRAQTSRGGSGMLEVVIGATAVAGSGSVLVSAGGEEQTGPVSSALADSLVVRATDALGNPVANVEVAWSVVTGGGSIDPATVVTGANGLAAAERVLGPAAGAQSAQAAVRGFTGSPVTFTHTAVPANPTALVKISGDEQTAPAGFEVAADLVVRLEDDNGNGIGGRAITWVVPAGSGSVNPVNTTTDPNGFAATRWTLPGAVGGYGVSAVFSGLPAVPFTGTASADVPTRIAMVSGNNQNAAVGAPLPNPLVVRVTDANDNPVAGVSVNWTAEVGGSVSSPTSGTDASGLAEIARTLGAIPGPHPTTAAVTGLSGSPVTFNSTALVGPPAQLRIVTQPGSPTTSGNAFAPAPVIAVQDAQGNQVPLGGVEVIASITSGQTGASLVNAERITNSSGRAVFSNLRISGPPDDDYVLTFAAEHLGAPLTSVSSVLLTVGTGGANRIVIRQQPSETAPSGSAFAVQPVVEVVDATGNPVTGDRTIEVDIGSGGAALGGTLTAGTGGGSTASFSGLRITGLVGDRTLIFSAGALTPAESNPISITPGPAATIALQAGDDQTADVGEAVPTPPSVIVRDGGGNPVSGVEVNFQVTDGDGDVDPETVTTGSDGIAAVNSWSLGPAAGENLLEATAPVLPVSARTVTFSATGTTASTTTSLGSGGTPNPSTEGQTVTFTATVSSAEGTPTGQVQFRNGSAALGAPQTLSDGVATLTTGDLPAGPPDHTITAEYLGGGGFAGSTSTGVLQTVNPPPPVNQGPAALNDPSPANAPSYVVNEDETLTVGAVSGVLANDTDPEDDPLSAVNASTPTNGGTVILNSDGSFTYTPALDFNGTDTFSYQANDGELSSTPATVTITVSSVNDPPTFQAGGDVSTSSLLSSVLGESHAGWASGISPGPPDESSQTVDSFLVSLNNEEPFQTLPQIDVATGNLTYQPDLRSDTVVISASAVAVDNGGVESAAQPFTITIFP